MTKSNDDRSATLGIDPGAGAIKIYGAAGGIQLPSIVSVEHRLPLSRMAGLSQARPPLHVRTRAGSFWLGSRRRPPGRVTTGGSWMRWRNAPSPCWPAVARPRTCPCWARRSTPRGGG